MSWGASFSDDRNVLESDGGLPRNDDADPLFNEVWNGILSNGTSAPDGSYKLALRALKLLVTDLNDPDSWDTYITPSFTIERP
jgi:hypothetical protein